MVSALDPGLGSADSSPGRSTALCSWARHSTLMVPLSTQLYKWLSVNLLLGVTLRWTSIPSRGEQKYSQSLYASETRISSGLMGHLAVDFSYFPYLEHLPITKYNGHSHVIYYLVFFSCHLQSQIIRSRQICQARQLVLRQGGCSTCTSTDINSTGWMKKQLSLAILQMWSYFSRLCLQPPWLNIRRYISKKKEECDRKIFLYQLCEIRVNYRELCFRIKKAPDSPCPTLY